MSKDAWLVLSLVLLLVHIAIIVLMWERMSFAVAVVWVLGGVMGQVREMVRGKGHER